MLWNTGEDKMIDGLILAFQFFTRIPIKREVEFKEENIRRSIFFFPLVGMVIGAIGAFIYYPISVKNKEVASLFSLLSTVFLTGGLHIDGLSDTFDGFLSNRDKEATLNIMKDSRIGAYGVLSIVVLLLSKFVILSNFKKGLVMALILSLGNSRLVVSRIITYKKNTRPGGMGELFHNSKPGNNLIIVGLIYIGIISMINIYNLIPLMVNFLVGELFSAWSYKKIDGMTGDTYGAIIEIGDTVSLLSFWGVMEWI